MPSASSDGIGTRSAETARSLRMRTVAPSACASSASRQIRSSAAVIPSAPSASGQVVSIV